MHGELGLNVPNQKNSHAHSPDITQLSGNCVK